MNSRTDDSQKESAEGKPRSKAVLFLLFVPLVVVIIVVVVAVKGTSVKPPKITHPDTPDFKAYEGMVEKLKGKLLEAKKIAKEYKIPRVEKTTQEVVAAVDKLYQESCDIPVKIIHDHALRLGSEAERIYNEEYVAVKDSGGDPKRFVLEECTIYALSAAIIYEAMREIYDYKRRVGELPQLQEGQRDKWEIDAQSLNELIVQLRKE
ncbi:MAG: hypothetical protein N2234_04225 [Planctomycetota bacterium]|nr:hypothetical protein [Planctomycetota bacterium]